VVTRRQALVGTLCAALRPRGAEAAAGPNATAGTAPLADAVPSDTRAVRGTLAVQEIAPGIFVRRGVDEDASAANDDAIANIGFVVGRDAVAVIDPGGSLRDGELLRASVLKATRLPIRYVVMTHVHPDHIFGAGAFQQDHPQFIGHQKLPQALAVRGEYYRKRLEQILGAGRAGPIVVPTRLVQAQDQIALGGGKMLRLEAHALAHSDCDLTVLEQQTATLFTGDLLFVQRVPSLDGSLKGWLTELNSLKTVAAQRAVPGHGPVSVKWPAASLDLERYLNGLLRETRAAIKKGIDIDAAVASVGQSERGRWSLFDAYQGHNVTQAFKELEWEQ
jgi:quinoprotein relay system zinc metallohydrolase 2